MNINNLENIKEKKVPKVPKTPIKSNKIIIKKSIEPKKDNPLEILNMYGIYKTNIRWLGEESFSKVFSTKDIESIDTFIKEKNLTEYNMYFTFNTISEDISKESVSDSDISKINFILIDIDTKRSDKSQPANEFEKEQSKDLSSKVIRYLELKKLDRYWYMDSGNGYHILIPIEAIDNNKDNVNSIKKFINILNNEFKSEYSSIDTTVYNPSRIVRFYGSKNFKDNPSIERPNRISSIISKPIDNSLNKIEIILDIIKSDITDGIYNNTIISDIESNESKFKIFARGEEWLASYSLNYEFFKEYDNGTRVYRFIDGCPLKEHNKTDKGAYFTVSKDCNCIFGCHHASCNCNNIESFNNRYPCPEDLIIKRNSIDVVPEIHEIKKQNYEFSNGDYVLNSTGLYFLSKDKKGKNGKLLKLCNPIILDKAIYNVDSNTFSYRIQSIVHGQINSIMVGAEILNFQEIKSLNKYGIFAYPNESELLKYLLYQKDLIELKHIHDVIGWNVQGKELLFNLKESYGSETLKSELNSNLDISFDNNGNYDEWISMINSDVIGSNLELALALGFSPIVLGYLSKTSHPDLGSLMINLRGASSTGKTTGLYLISSIFGSPKSQFNTFNSTENALIETISNNFGVPIIVDEFGTSQNKKKEELIYRIATGTGRKRLNADSRIQEVKKFNTILFSTSENSVLDKLEKYSGLFVRFIEFSNDEWSKDSTSSKNIKRICSQNYGWAAVKFIEKLFSNDKGINLIDEKYQEAYDILDRLPESNLKERIRDVYSIVLSSAILVKELLGIEINIEYIVDFLTKTEDTSIKKRNIIPEDFSLKLREYLLKNRYRFYDDEDVTFFRNYIGAIKNIRGKEYYEIYKNVFELEILENYFGIYDRKKAILYLNNHSILSSNESNRNYVRTTINGSKNVPCYRLNFKNLEEATEIQDDENIDI